MPVTLDAVYERLGRIQAVAERLQEDVTQHMVEDRVFHLDIASRVTSLEASSHAVDSHVEAHKMWWIAVTAVAGVVLSCFSTITAFWRH
jgi:hypothetical protein